MLDPDGNVVQVPFKLYARESLVARLVGSWQIGAVRSDAISLNREPIHEPPHREE